MYPTKPYDANSYYSTPSDRSVPKTRKQLYGYITEDIQNQPDPFIFKALENIKKTTPPKKG